VWRRVAIAMGIDDVLGAHVRVSVMRGEQTVSPVREIRIDGQDGRGWWLEGPPEATDFDPAYVSLDGIGTQIMIGRAGDLDGDGVQDIVWRRRSGTRSGWSAALRPRNVAARRSRAGDRLVCDRDFGRRAGLGFIAAR
jgi:hypothetical protein